VVGLLLAAVDTTSNYMNWIMLHLACNPDKQEKLAKELKEILKGGDYNKDQPLPYLQACYRESHRLTPVQLGIYRYLDEPIGTYIYIQLIIVINFIVIFHHHSSPLSSSDLNGYNIPAGTKLTFNLEAIQKDPAFVDAPEVYSPERWLPEAVESRKGTPSEILDHRLLATPFSFGPRMCLGGRLAELEIKTLFARLVQDYEFTIAPDSPEVKVHEFLFLTPLPSPKFEIKRRI
jgi:cytochrome P450 family 12